MSYIIQFFKEYFLKFVVWNFIFLVAGNAFYPAILSMLIYKQNFIYLLSTSPIIGSYAVLGFCVFVFALVSTIVWQIFNNI